MAIQLIEHGLRDRERKNKQTNSQDREVGWVVEEMGWGKEVDCFYFLPSWKLGGNKE